MIDQVSTPTSPLEQESEVRAILAQAVIFERSREPRLAHAQFKLEEDSCVA
ncbi:MAG TPA: hypothetical protein V6C97_07905 [Oculatellaceae cyanobacterium]